eukprot:1507958-Rhodomonas_salina.2
MFLRWLCGSYCRRMTSVAFSSVEMWCACLSAVKLRCEEREREICVDILALSVENVTDQRFAAQRSAAQISLPQNGVCRPDFPPSEPTEPGEGRGRDRNPRRAAPEARFWENRPLLPVLMRQTMIKPVIHIVIIVKGKAAYKLQ